MDSNQRLNNIVSVIGIAAGVHLVQKRSRYTKRKWIKEWRRDRAINSQFTLVHAELRLKDVDYYRRYLRMNEDCFKLLLTYVKPYLTKQTTVMRVPVSPEEALSATLRFLATGESFYSLDMSTKLSKSYLATTIPLCCSIIYQQLRRDYLKFPATVEEWELIAADFGTRWDFPLCLGALDGKHVQFRASKCEKIPYYNYKGFHSIVLLAMCDSYYRFTYANIGCNGRISDGGVLNRSNLRAILSNAEKYFPADKVIGSDRCLPYCIVGDDAFPLEKHLMKPYSYTTSNAYEKTFNFRLGRARQTIEHAFGMLANRFRVLMAPIFLCPAKVTNIVEACVVLQNFLITNADGDMPILPPAPYQPSDSGPLDMDRHPSIIAEAVRNELSAYFSEEGQLQYQDQFVPS